MSKYYDYDANIQAAIAASLETYNPVESIRSSDDDIIKLSGKIYAEYTASFPRQLSFGSLKNCGNSCYLNTGLQFLYNIDSIRNFILFNDFSSLLSIKQTREDYFKLIITQIIFILLSQGERNIDLENINNVNIYDKYLELLIFESGLQHDITEFIPRFLNIFQSILPYYNQAIVYDVLKSISFNDIVIRKCIESHQYIVENPATKHFYRSITIDPITKQDVYANPYEPLWRDYGSTLELPLNGSTLQECINSYQSWKIQERQNLYSCNTKYFDNEYHKLDNFRETNYYIISLKRFIFDMSTFTRKKDMKNIKIENTITISNEQFRLKGCGVHTGVTANSGHYFYIYFDETGTRFYFNDRHMGETNTSSQFDNIDIYGYIFLYEKINNSPSVLPFQEYQELAQRNLANGIEITFPRPKPPVAPKPSVKPPVAPKPVPKITPEPTSNITHPKLLPQNFIKDKLKELKAREQAINKTSMTGEQLDYIRISEAKIEAERRAEEERRKVEARRIEERLAAERRAEDERQLAEAKRIEERIKLEEVKRKFEESEKRRQIAEVRRSEERLAAEKRAEDERRLAEARIRFEEARKIEEERLAAERRLIQKPQKLGKLELNNSLITPPPKDIIKDEKLHKDVINNLIRQLNLEPSKIEQRKVLFLEFYDCIVPIKFNKDNEGKMIAEIKSISDNKDLVESYKKIFVALYKKYDFIKIISIYPSIHIDLLMKEIIPLHKQDKQFYSIINFYQGFSDFNSYPLVKIIINMIDRIIKHIIAYLEYNIPSENILIVNRMSVLEFIKRTYGINVIRPHISGIPFLELLLTN